MMPLVAKAGRGLRLLRRAPVLGASRAAAAVLVWGIAAASPGVARADAVPDPHEMTERGDAVGALAILADGYKKGALPVFDARLYQDLLREAGRDAALFEETKAAYPEPRGPLGQYLFARLTEPKTLDAALQKLVATAPDPIPIFLDQAWGAIAIDKLPHAKALLERLKKSAPGSEEVALIEARVFEAAPDREAAEHVLAAHVAGHPASIDARRAWARILLALRRPADAARVVEEALVSSRCAPLLVCRAGVARAMGDLALAKKCLGEAGTAGRPALVAEGYALRAAVRLLEKDPLGAEQAADAGLKACPLSVPALRAKARALEAQKKFSDALARIDAALAVEPTLGILHSDRGILLKWMGQTKEARRELWEAKKRDPDDLTAPWYLGVLAEEEKDWSAAEKIYRALLKIAPDDVDAHRMLAGVLFNLSQLDKADAEAAWIRERNPKDPEAWMMSGRVALVQDKLDDAVAAFKKAIEADPTYALGHTGLGWAYVEQDKPTDAKAAFEAAIAADKTLALPHRNLAELLDTDLNDPKGALEHFRAYLDLGGEDPDEDVKHSIERLSK